MIHTKRRALVLLALAAALPLGATSAQTPSPAGARVYFLAPADGAVVKAPVRVVMGLAGMGIAPAGVEFATSGHHHILVDRAPFGEGPNGRDELTSGIPADDNHVHFGRGQTETTLALPPGRHTLQLVLGDHNHVPHVPPVVSTRITITVE